jgi:hypothetical protein
MAGLTGLLPKNTYGDLIRFNNANAGNPAAPATIQDGLGNALGIAIGGGWMQQTSGDAALNAGFTKANASLAATNLSFTVLAGRSYRITGCLQVSNTTAAEGVQIDFAGGSATATTFFMNSTAAGSVVVGTVVSTSLAGVINYTTITGTDYLNLNGYLLVNAAGTFIMRAAENTTATGTLTVGVGSWLELNDTVRV